MSRYNRNINYGSGSMHGGLPGPRSVRDSIGSILQAHGQKKICPKCGSNKRGPGLEGVCALCGTKMIRAKKQQ